MQVIFKTAAGDGGLDFVLSDETVDRYGDIILADGWDLRNFKKNPIALFGHSSGFPIGTWADLRIDGKRLVGRLVLAAKGTSQRIDELISLVEQGILRAVSVGFRPIDSDPSIRSSPGARSATRSRSSSRRHSSRCPRIPAALALAKSLNLSTETMSLAFGEHAETRRRDRSAPGGNADNPPVIRRILP